MSNDFKQFGGGGGANVLTQAQYEALATLIANGFQTGVAPSNQFNKVWRQATMGSAVLGELIAGITGQNVVDDGTTATIASNLMAALALAGYKVDTGAVNAYVVTLVPAPLAYYNGMKVSFKTANANTISAPTLNVNGLGAITITGVAGSALSASQIPANSIVEAVYNSTGPKFELCNSSTGSASQTFSVAPATSGTMAPEANQMIGRNLIVNGSCQVDQVNSGALVSPLVSGGYTVDNSVYYQSTAGKLSGQQITSALNSLGATHAIRRTVLAQFTPAAGDYFRDEIIVEGLNSSHLQWGTVNAAPVSLQFKAAASVSGTYSGCIRNIANTRTYPFTFTLSANTDTLVKIENIIGCTDGVWVKTNAADIILSFSYGVGSTYGAPSTGAWLSAFYFGVLGSTNLVSQVNGSTLDISDVQLEKGSYCTTFERKLYDQVLRDCQRYYEGGLKEIWSGQTTSGSSYYSNISYKVSKRTTPSMIFADVSDVAFPTTVPILNDSNIGSFQAYKIANATNASGYYQFSWSASARL